MISSDKQPNAGLMAIRILMNIYQTNFEDIAFSPSHIGFVSVLASILRSDSDAAGEMFSYALQLTILLSLVPENISALASDDTHLLDSLNTIICKRDVYSSEQLLDIVALLNTMSADPHCAAYATSEGTFLYNIFDMIHRSTPNDGELTCQLLNTVSNVLSNSEPDTVAETVVTMPTLCVVLDQYVTTVATVDDGSACRILALTLHIIQILLTANVFSAVMKSSLSALAKSLVRVVSMWDREGKDYDNIGSPPPEAVLCAEAALKLLQIFASRPGYVKSLYSRDLDLLGLLSTIICSDRGSLRPVALVTLLNLSAHPESFQYGHGKGSACTSPADVLTGLLSAIVDEAAETREVALEIVHKLSHTAAHMTSIISSGTQFMNSLLSVVRNNDKAMRVLGLKLLLELSESSSGGGLSLMIIQGENLLCTLKQVVMECVDANETVMSIVVFNIIAIYQK